MHEIIHKRILILRYLLSSIDTLKIIFKAKPDIVFAQNPSIVLACLVVALRRVFNYCAVIDAHNSGIRPREGRNAFLMTTARWLQRHAVITLVTNEKLQAAVTANAGRSFVLPDKIPNPPKVGLIDLGGSINIACICTYALDEPFLEVFEAASLLPDDFVIYVTGNYGAYPPKVSHKGNLRFLGFIPEDRYWSLLASVDIVLDLTTREDCLVCGAYEAVALGKPAILSKTQTIMEYFNRGCLYAESNPSSIALTILHAIDQLERLRAEMLALKESLESDLSQRLTQLELTLGAACNRA